jgi:hypothetical protein
MPQTPEPAKAQVPTTTQPFAALGPGAIVIYRMGQGHSKGKERAAIIADLNDKGPNGTADIWVFGNPQSDGVDFLTPQFLAGVQHGTGPGQWS